MDIRVVKRDRRPDASAPESDAPAAEPIYRPERKQVYLRTIYPLNAGIPHTVDFPEMWKRKESA